MALYSSSLSGIVGQIQVQIRALVRGVMTSSTPSRGASAYLTLGTAMFRSFGAYFTLTMLNVCLSIAGTFHRLWGTLVSSFTGANNKGDELMRQAEPQVAGPEGVDSGWYIDASDLEFFVSRVERRDAPVRASNWEPLLQKQIPGEMVYHAYRRMLKDIRKTEYLSTSVTADTSPHEVRSSLRRLRT